MHVLSSESRNMSRGPQDTRSENQIIERTSRLKITESRKCRWQSTVTTPYNGTGNQTQITQIRSTADVKPSMLYQSHGLTVCFEINHDDVKIYPKRLSDLTQFPSISPPVSLWPPKSELYWRKSGHRDQRKTLHVCDDNTSWATRCQHSTQLNSTQIQREEAQGAYINPRSLKKNSRFYS